MSVHGLTATGLQVISARVDGNGSLEQDELDGDIDLNLLVQASSFDYRCKGVRFRFEQLERGTRSTLDRCCLARWTVAE